MWWSEGAEFKALSAYFHFSSDPIWDCAHNIELLGLYFPNINIIYITSLSTIYAKNSMRGRLCGKGRGRGGEKYNFRPGAALNSPLSSLHRLLSTPLLSSLLWVLRSDLDHKLVRIANWTKRHMTLWLIAYSQHFHKAFNRKETFSFPSTRFDFIFYNRGEDICFY